MSHFSRKCYSTVKEQLQNQAGFSAVILSAMDTVFMSTYAAGNIISGKLGDTFSPTVVLAIGLFGSGFCLFLINVALWFDFVGMSVTLGNVFILLVYAIFGFFQSTGGPVGTAVMGNWFCDAASVKNRGTIFGFWTCHQYCGDITAALCTAWVLGIGLPYWWALLIPALTNFGWSFITARLVADPVELDIITPEVRARHEKNEAKRKEMAEKGEIMEEDSGPPPITYAGALAIPMVAQYAFAFGFFKLINYVLFFWLPYFLGKTFDPVTANLIAALYSVGMMPGGIIVGYVSDWFGGRRAVVIAVFMGILIVFLGVFSQCSESLPATVLLIMLGCMGILVGGYDHANRTATFYVLCLCHVHISLVPFVLSDPTILSLLPLLLTWPRTRLSMGTTRPLVPLLDSLMDAVPSQLPSVFLPSGLSKTPMAGDLCGSSSLYVPLLVQLS